MKSDATGKPLGTDLEKLRALTDEEIVIDDDTPYDPDDPAAVEAFWKNAVVVHEGGPAAVRAALAAKPRAGRPAGGGRKASTTVRFDHEVLDYFRATGKGWQSRMNQALREWIAQHPR